MKWNKTLAFQRKEILTDVTVWNLEDTMLSERSWSPKGEYCVTYFYEVSKFIKSKNRIEAARGWGRIELFNTYRVSNLKDETSVVEVDNVSCTM